MKKLAQVLRRILLAIVAFGGVAAAQAADPAHARWACWYQSNDLSVQCLLVSAIDTSSEQRGADLDRRFGERLPGLVRTIWAKPEQLAGARVSIPLGTLPFEMAFVGDLARAVMCGVQKGCSVAFDSNSDDRADVRAAAIEAGVSEQEVMAEVEAQGFKLASAAPASETSAKKPRRRKPLFG